MSWLRDIASLFTFLSRWSRSLPGARLMAWGLVVAGGISGLANAAFLALITDALQKAGEAVDSRQIWAFVGLCVLLPASRLISGVLLLKLAGRAGFELRTQIGRRVLATPMRKLEEVGPHRLLATFTEDIPRIIGAMVSYPNLLMQLFIIVGCLAYLAWLSPPALLAVLGVMTLGIITHQLPVTVANRTLESMREDWDRLAESIRGLIEGSKELKMHRGRRREFFLGGFEPAARSVERKSIVGRSILHAAASWGHVLFFIVIGLTIFLGPSVLGVDRKVLTGFTLLILYMMTPIEAVLASLPDLATASVSVRKVESIGVTLDAPETESLAPLPAASSDWRSLRLRGVTHLYGAENTDERFQLGPIDLEIRPGELLFLTGGNGSGKTTLAKVICGLYSPEQGAVVFDGREVSEENREEYRQHFSAIFSDVFLFASLHGLREDEVDIDREAADYLHKLRLDQVVKVEDGSFSRLAVSQGQKKRLALLAAYLEDRPIYLFDEWAADQDVSFREFFYRELLPELRARGKTVIVVSHDDQYYDAADRIVILDRGRLRDVTQPVRPVAGSV